ncbi:hypothetical protein ES702_00753 [subsurface metagenome]
MSRQLVERWFNKLSSVERDLPLLIVAGTAYTPRTALNEVKRGTALGKKLQSLIEKKSFGTNMIEERTLAKMRLHEILIREPEKPMFVTIQGLAPRSYTPRQLLREIDANTKIGRQWVANEIKHVRRVLAVR